LGAIVALLEAIDTTKGSAVLTEKLGDLYGAQGKPSSSVRAYEGALKLDPSPQQRLRLRLTLGEKLLALDRAPEAYANLQKLLEEFPNYPDKLALYRKLLALAQKLDKKTEAEAYQAEIDRLSPPPKSEREQTPGQKPPPG
jgi:tetratricopeptide (TPR) repeat protein